MLTRRMLLQLVGASAGATVTGSQLLSRAASAAPARLPHGSAGVEHVVVLMMENRSFDHFLGWVPGADGRHDLEFPAADGNVYRNYPLAPDFQGCGYSDPDHSWEGFLVQRNGGRMDGFLQRPTTPENNPGVVPAAANTFPIGYYQHAARTDRDHNSGTNSTLPTIWDQLSPIPNTQGIPTGGYFFRDLPFLGLWGTKYYPFWHPFAAGDGGGLGIPVATPSFVDTVAAGNLPNVSFIDPAFDTEGNGTSADDHPLADVRLGERFIADAYHALSDAGYLDNTVFVVTFDEWGGFYDHVPPPRVRDDTDPSTVDHTGDATTPTDGRLVPDYRQLGFRVPAIVVSNLAPSRVVHDGPFEHTSTLKLIESTFGLNAMTSRDAHAENLGQVLDHHPHRPVPSGAIPRSSQVLGPVTDTAALCSASSVRSVSPPPVRHHHPRAAAPSDHQIGAGMVDFGRHYREEHTA